MQAGRPPDATTRTGADNIYSASEAASRLSISPRKATATNHVASNHDALQLFSTIYRINAVHFTARSVYETRQTLAIQTTTA